MERETDPQPPAAPDGPQWWTVRTGLRLFMVGAILLGGVLRPVVWVWDRVA